MTQEQGFKIRMSGAYTVSQITNYIKNLFERDYVLNRISVSGEISNCRYHSNGNIYFTLKDSTAQLNCIMFARERSSLSIRLSDGQQIEAQGRIAVYEKGGSYSLHVRGIKLEGAGELYERFLKLKAELENMGMFDPMYKKPIPEYCMSIGIVTAPAGAAIHDIINISTRRNPYVRLVLCPALVQGAGAADSISKGLKRLDGMGLDVIIVGRGGGSIEDLWAFNEPEVAKTIFDMQTPVISAVGHETDYTIADFVADLRAPTPSAAAELANFVYDDLMEELDALKGELKSSLLNRIRNLKAELKAYNEKLLRLSPQNVMAEKKRRMSELSGRMKKAMDLKIRETQSRLSDLDRSLREAMQDGLADSKRRYELLASRLDGLSPLKRISGGYGYLMTDKGSVKSVRDVNNGDMFKAYISDGYIEGKVLNTEET